VTRSQEKRLPTRLDPLVISSWQNGNGNEWAACLREYDLDVKVFTGPTQRAAINELLDYYEQDNGDLRE